MAFLKTKVLYIYFKVFRSSYRHKLP